MNDEFTDRRKRHAQRSAATGRVPLYATFLTKGDRCRLYRIDQVDAMTWKCQVMIGAHPHRFAVVTGRPAANRMRDEYRREVADLLKDGWLEATD